MCAECEVALLQLHDFEELITYLKVGIDTLTSLYSCVPYVAF